MREGYRVVGPDGKPMPDLFREIKLDRSQVTIQSLTNGVPVTVHCTRIISSKKEEAMATKKVSGTPKFDFKTIAGERWSKPMAFDHKGVKAEAHVIVNRITKKYRAFNTYNASLGKQGKTGSVFAFKDYAQLAARLMDRGYKRVGGAPVAKKAVGPTILPKAKPVKSTTVKTTLVVEKGGKKVGTIPNALVTIVQVPKAKPAPAPVKEAPNANVPAQPVAPPAPPAQS